ncbi:MAG: ABC transporter permease, partial [Ensifer adhaerens]|nr:ABC transporter permease [Ensifer adhaerens]
MFIRLIALSTLAFLVLPLVVVIGVSLTETKFLAFPPQGLTLSWYAVVLENPTYIRSFLTSAVLAALATLVAILVALPAAIAMARYAFPGKSALSALML